MQRRKRKPSKIERHAAKMAMQAALRTVAIMRDGGSRYTAVFWITGYRHGVQAMLDCLRAARTCSRYDRLTKMLQISDPNWKPATRRRKCRKKRRLSF